MTELERAFMPSAMKPGQWCKVRAFDFTHVTCPDCGSMFGRKPDPDGTLNFHCWYADCTFNQRVKLKGYDGKED